MPFNIRSSLSYCYMRDISTLETLEFEYIPDEISESKSANYNYTDILGRSEPIIGYINSSVREISLHLIFIAGVGQCDKVGIRHDAGGNIAKSYDDEDTPLIVKKKVDWLRSLVYPDYENPNFVRPPHTIMLSLGDLIKSSGIVTSVNVTYKGPWDKYLLPYIAEVDISFQEIWNVPPGHTSVRQGLTNNAQQYGF